mmetsp:Transcript_23130/g.37520  ORF Transcript_23130/g.37520 Transcript_23130/m.37520 type:complete len:117 (-) Transcript_23130:86-436(-)
MPTQHKLTSMIVVYLYYALSTSLVIHIAGFSSGHIQHIRPTTNHHNNLFRAVKYPTLIQLNSGLNEDNNNQLVENNNSEDNFDGKGFAGYLAPYAVALLGSIAVTAAFVKFVLMDY